MKILLYKIGFFVMTALNKLIPKNEKKIIIYGDEILADNSKALFNYLVDNKYNENYEIVCLIKDMSNYNDVKINNVKFKSGIFNILYHHITSKYIFLYISCLYFRGKPMRGQIIFNLWHGSPLKSIGYVYDGGEYWRKREKMFSYILAGSNFFKGIMKNSYNCEDNQIFIGGNPRNDLLFSKKNCFLNLGIKKSNYKKLILWMPTWRTGNSDNGRIKSKFPILDINNMEKLNKYLVNNKILLIIKPHPLQINIDIFKFKQSNIFILENSDLEKNDVELYELLGQVDVLLTDYSSVYFDFLLTMKPIGFTIDDFDSYGKNRGFVVDNPLDLMPGEKITDFDELISFINDINNGKDLFFEERKKINDMANKYKDGNNTKRILDYLGL